MRLFFTGSLALVWLAACGAIEDTPEDEGLESVTTSRADIERLHTEWAQAIRDGDIDRALGLLASDYVLWAAGAPPITGHAVRPFLESALALYDIEARFESEEFLVSGDLAIERGWDIATITPRAGGPSQTQRQRVFVILWRVDGRWQYARGMSQPGPPDE